MRKVWLGVRSTALWAVSGIHFADGLLYSYRDGNFC